MDLTPSPAGSLADLTARLCAAKAVSAEDVLALRRIIYPDANISQDEAEALIGLDEAADARAPEWDALFREAMTDYLIYQEEPSGYIDAAKADWLIAALTRDGQIKTDSELELLVHLLANSQTSPARLPAFALDQVKNAILTKDGPLMRGGVLRHGVITAGAVELLRRTLYAAGGDGNVAITRAEAEVLFDLNDACQGADNDPAWTDFFAKALAASVMTVSGWTPLTREEAVRQEAWLEAPGSGYGGIGGFLGKMFGGAPKAIAGMAHGDFGADDGLDGWRLANERFEVESEAAEKITDDEAQWLASRIGRDGKYDAAERALIAFLKAEAPALHPALQGLLDAA